MPSNQKIIGTLIRFEVYSLIRGFWSNPRPYRPQIRCTYEADGVAMAFTKPCDGSTPKQVRVGCRFPRLLRPFRGVSSWRFWGLGSQDWGFLNSWSGILSVLGGHNTTQFPLLLSHLQLSRRCGCDARGFRVQIGCLAFLCREGGGVLWGV